MDFPDLNILFTCAGRRVALLEAFRGAMAELDVVGQVLATDVSPVPAAFQTADAGFLVPRTDDPAYIDRLLEIVDLHGVGLLVPLTDLDLLDLADARQAFADLGCTVMIGTPQVARLCEDKRRLDGLLAGAGLPRVRTACVAEFLAEPFYPCFAKPIRGSAGIGAQLIRDGEHLRAHLAAFGRDLLVQEVLEGKEFTIDVYRSRDGVVRCAVPRQRLRVRGGEVQEALTVKDPLLIEAACRLAARLPGLWGAFCCQCRVGPDGRPRFFEINPRFGGGAPLSIAAGANLPLYLLQEVLGLALTAKLDGFVDRMVMARYDDAVFCQVDDPTCLVACDAPRMVAARPAGRRKHRPSFRQPARQRVARPAGS